jgi:hypothetical protein
MSGEAAASDHFDAKELSTLLKATVAGGSYTQNEVLTSTNQACSESVSLIALSFASERRKRLHSKLLVLLSGDTSGEHKARPLLVCLQELK